MKGFCEKCRDLVDFTQKEMEKEFEIRGKKYSYSGKEAYCNECHEEIFVSDIRDYNLSKLDASFREAEHLIRTEDIEKILGKYDIGKRPLSLLLGWGEGTLTRYIDGDIPSKPFSDQLKRILEDDTYFRTILEENKAKIKPVTYQRSKKALELIHAATQRGISKLESAVIYLLLQASEITPLALQKLLYFAQGFHRAFCDVFLFEEDCEAWVQGPVYRVVYEKYRNYGCHPIEEKELSGENINLTEDEKKLLDYVLLYFGCYSGKILELMTHTEKPWRAARKGLMDHESSARIIEKEKIKTYFCSVKDKYQMLNLTDMKDYSKALLSNLSH